MSAIEVHGRCDPRFAVVRSAFEANLKSGADVGASFAATVDGELVVDLWGGFKDAAGTQPWEEDTIVNVYSTTKTMCALTALLCADRGLFAFTDKVSLGCAGITPACGSGRMAMPSSAAVTSAMCFSLREKRIRHAKATVRCACGSTAPGLAHPTCWC